MKIYAPAKINLFLDVLERAENNYHNIITLFQAINLYDEIEIKESEEEKINTIPPNFIKGKNIVSKVLDEFKNLGIDKKFEITIKKNIPIGAGLGGGSSDAAAVCIGIIRLLNLNISEFDILKKIGADASFFIKGGSQIGYHYGEILKEIEIDFYYNIVLIYPDIVLSTKEMYNLLEAKFFKRGEEKLKKIIEAINKKEKEEFFKNLYNIFEKFAFEKYPVLKDLKEELFNFGAVSALMSGSGSSIYGIFTAPEKAYQYFKYIKSTYKNSWLCYPIKEGVKIIGE